MAHQDEKMEVERLIEALEEDEEGNENFLCKIVEGKSFTIIFLIILLVCTKQLYPSTM